MSSSHSSSTSKHLSRDVIDRLREDIYENMKSNGTFDEMRVRLANLIYDDETEFKKIVGVFQGECLKFCEQVDLSKPRNKLRNELADRIQRNCRKDLNMLIDRLMANEEDKIRSDYRKHAGDYLRRRFMPNHDDSPPELSSTTEQQAEVDMDITPSPAEDHSERTDKTTTNHDMDVDDDDCDIKPPPYSPIGNPLSVEANKQEEILIKKELLSNGQIDDEETNRQQQIDTQMENHKNMSSLGARSNDNLTTKEPNNFEDHGTLDHEEIKLENIPIPEGEYEDFKEVMEKKIEYLNSQQEEAIDNLSEMTFSSVSSVHTIDLKGEYDDYINLSDDEATIVGKPKNSKVPVSEIQGQIDDLQTTAAANTTAMQTESDSTMVIPNSAIPNKVAGEASESDGGCSESATTGRRVSRTRKQNPKYSTDFVKL